MRIIQAMKLVIVESPSKAKTIEKYLGKEYTVRSSIGHIRDLPKSNKDALDIEAGFVPHYVISPGKGKIIKELATLAKKADEILLAPDPDREGEAIAWHLAEVLKDTLKKDMPETKRVSFNEITKDAVLEAIKTPRDIDMHLKEAQEARRVLDRLVGYDLSGLIWKKVRYGLSAGRVQSPALRILMEREREIRAFEPEAYYTLEGIFEKGSLSFPLVCSKEPTQLEEALEIVSKGEAGSWSVVDIKESTGTRKAKAPFTTSTLQQAASSRLGFSPSRTMRAAQKLYEAGHITYMRTDSQSLSKQALAQIARYVETSYGPSELSVTQYKTKSKNAQEAHEAIRPTQFSKTIQGSSQDEKSLYSLIFQRTVASQMKEAEIIRTKLSANIETGDIPDFVMTGSRIVKLGWLACDTQSRGEDTELPLVKKGDALTLKEMHNTEKFTTPPNRYSEAGLIKELEKRGIGRPSTYASILKTLVDRAYVEKEGRTLIPTDTGDVVSSFLENNFMNYINDDFTASMEDHLDAIADGSEGYIETLKNFYTPFQKDVASKEDIPKITNLGPAPKEFSCPLCSSAMMYKLGRTGKFMSCSRYPDCEGALTLEGKELGNETPLGQDPITKENIYVLEGRFGPYVQQGETPEKVKKDDTKEEKERKKAMKAPKRASLPANMKAEDITLEQALHLLKLPRELGVHPESGDMVIANIGRFGPYVGHGQEFRSLKKTSGLDPYTITFDEAIKVLKEPKSLPKGVELYKDLGKHPKTGKDIRILKSKSGFYIQKGLRRLYIDDKDLKDGEPKDFTLDDALKML